MANIGEICDLLLFSPQDRIDKKKKNFIRGFIMFNII